MYPSTYLSWFRRLLILGAVVAGLTASAAGARLDPGTPPEVSDVASAYAAAHPYGSDLSSTTPVSRIIDQEQGRQRDLGLFSLGLSTSTTSNDGSDFAWSDWAIGVGAGIGIALLLAIGLMIGRQQRRVQPA